MATEQVTLSYARKSNGTGKHDQFQQIIFVVSNKSLKIWISFAKMGHASVTCMVMGNKGL